MSNDIDQERLSDEEYDRMEWLETKEDRGVMTLEEKEELTSLQQRWCNKLTEGK